MSWGKIVVSKLEVYGTYLGVLVAWLARHLDLCVRIRGGIVSGLNNRN